MLRLLLPAFLLAVSQTLGAYENSDLRERDRLVVLLFGDSGTGEAGQYRVGEAMFRVCAERGCDFALMMGDNVYDNGIEVTRRDSARGSYEEILAQFREKFEDAYASFHGIKGFRFWAILGNHDYRKNAVGSMITYSEFSDLWRLPAFHYQVPLLPPWIQVYGVHTDTDERRDLNGLQVEAARRALCATGESPHRWKIVFGHNPVYNSGHHRNDGNERRVRSLLEKPLLQACGVHLYISGHAHHQEHLTATGFEQVIQGAAAKSKGSNRFPDHLGVAQRHYSQEFGFGVLEIDAERLRLDYYDVLNTKEKGGGGGGLSAEDVVLSYSWCGGRDDIGRPAAAKGACP